MKFAALIIGTLISINSLAQKDSANELESYTSYILKQQQSTDAQKTTANPRRVRAMSIYKLNSVSPRDSILMDYGLPTAGSMYDYQAMNYDYQSMARYVFGAPQLFGKQDVQADRITDSSFTDVSNIYHRSTVLSKYNAQRLVTEYSLLGLASNGPKYYHSFDAKGRATRSETHDFNTSTMQNELTFVRKIAYNGQDKIVGDTVLT